MHDYFFSGDQYIRMTRVDTGPGTVDRVSGADVELGLGRVR